MDTRKAGVHGSLPTYLVGAQWLAGSHPNKKFVVLAKIRLY
jgi:hypothetical protein